MNLTMKTNDQWVTAGRNLGRPVVKSYRRTDRQSDSQWKVLAVTNYTQHINSNAGSINYGCIVLLHCTILYCKGNKKKQRQLKLHNTSNQSNEAYFYKVIQKLSENHHSKQLLACENMTYSLISLLIYKK